MFDFKLPELIIILLIVLLLFGSKKLPELSSGIGEAIKNIRKGFSDDTNEGSSKKASKNK